VAVPTGLRASLALLVSTAAVAGCGDEPRPAATVRADADRVPAFAPQPASGRERPTADEPAGRWLTARLKKPTKLRRAPGGRAVARLRTRTEFGSPRVLGVVARRDGWLQVVATELPNGDRAWIRSADARLGSTDWSIRVDRSARRLVLRRGDSRVERLTVAVGRPDTPTPRGRFTVTDKLRPARADSPYGCCIVALSGRQTKLVEGWPGGDRLAIHATPQTETIGDAASLGCLRARDADVRALMRRVPLGTPVFIRS